MLSEQVIEVVQAETPLHDGNSTALKRFIDAEAFQIDSTHGTRSKSAVFKQRTVLLGVQEGCSRVG